jgi:hypothetical protein
LVSVVCGLLSVPLLYAFFTRFCDIEQDWAIGIALLNGISPLSVYFAAGSVLTETSYTFFAFLALFLIERYLAKKHASYWILLLAALLATYATLIRVPGITLVGAVLVFLFLRRRVRETMLFGLAVGISMSPWLYRNYLIGGAQALTFGYGHIFMRRAYSSIGTVDLGSGLHRLIYNAWAHATDTTLRLMLPTLTGGRLLDFLAGLGLAWLPAMTGLVLSALIALGFFAHARRSLHIYHVYTLFYGMFILLPPWFIARNLLPVLPLLLLFLAEGLRTIALWVERKWGHTAGLPYKVVLVVLGIMITSSLVSDRHELYAASNYRRTGVHTDADRSYLEAVEWVKEHTIPEDVIMYKYPGLLVLHSQRKTVGLSYMTPEELFQKYVKGRVTYIMLNQTPLGRSYDDPKDEDCLKPMIAKYPDSFALIYVTPSEPKVAIYQVVGGEQ